MLIIFSSGVYYPLEVNTLIILIVYNTFFSIGSIVYSSYYQIKKSQIKTVSKDSKKINKKKLKKISFILYGLTLFLMICAPLFYKALLNSIIIIDNMGLLYSIRFSFLNNKTPSSFWMNLISFSIINTFLCSLLYKLDKKKSNLYLLILSLLPLFYYNLLTGGRSGVVLAVLGLLSILLIGEKKLSLKVLGIFTTLFLIFWSIIQFTVKKDSFVSSYDNKFLFIFDSMIQYYAGGTLALNQYMNGDYFTVNAVVSFLRTPLQILNQTGLFSFELGNRHLPYVNISELRNTNVYTSFFNYMQEFNYFEVILLQIFLGVVSSFIYERAIGKNYTYVILYSYIFTGVIMSPYSDQYFDQLIFLIKLMIAYLIVFYRYSHQKDKEEDFVHERYNTGWR